MASQFLIAAVSSGSGKTTLTMGILRALCKQGLRVQPFKCGPDYIDTKFHTLATGCESVNLDTWMASKAHLREIFCRYGREADVCVVEGMMGLFDGYSRMEGSAADIALTLNLPVVLVVNSLSMAYTVAAQLYGMKHFCPGLQIAGVIFNRVSSDKHFALLKDACQRVGIECLGRLPKCAELEIPSRHLGLTLSAQEEMERQIALSASLVEENLDLQRLLSLSEAARPQVAEFTAPKPLRRDMKIAVARDAAFNFTYRENISRLGQYGKLVFFSPLSGDRLPECDFLYLPGGYPELFARELEDNSLLREDISNYAENGGRILAECGGMIYLCKSLIQKDGTRHAMCAVLPMDCTMEGAHLHLGYRSLTDASGNQFKGHEFHYSEIIRPDTLPSVARQTDVNGNEADTPLYRYKNVIAGYTHLYWGESDIMKLWD